MEPSKRKWACVDDEQAGTPKQMVIEACVIESHSGTGEEGGQADNANNKDEAETDKIHQAIMQVELLQNDALQVLDVEFDTKIMKLKREYNVKRRPLYELRSAMTREIPHFWSTVFTNHLYTAQLMGDEDEEVLMYCSDVSVEEHEDRIGCTIKFEFEKGNPYFTNRTLTKTVFWEDDICVKEGCTIDWKEGMDLTSLTSGITENECVRTIFEWFCDVSGDVDVLADTIKDELWPNPYQYYIGSTADTENGSDRYNETEPTMLDGDGYPDDQELHN